MAEQHLIESVEDALAIEDPETRSTVLGEIARAEFAARYHESDWQTWAASFAGDVSAAWLHTKPDSSAETIAEMIAAAADNAALLAGIEPGAEVMWVTERDDKVRDLHVPMDGVTQFAGQPFIVGGVPLLYPGQPIGPPEVWINCRCHLDSAVAASGGDMDELEVNDQFDESTTQGFSPLVPTTTTSTMSGELTIVAVSDKPWSSFSASDYSIEQWRRACLLKMPGGDPESKSTYKLPVREPGGALNRNGVHAAAGRLNQTHAPPEAIAAAKRKLRGLYSQLGEKPPDSLAADALTGWAPSTSPPGTHDAPGWITNPRETQRLRTYWTKGAGAAKIAWGAPGDFNRCRKQLAKYVTNPQWLAGTCANLHFVALGFWPGQGPHASGEPPADPEGHAVTEAFVAAGELDGAEEVLPPLEWFTDPAFDGPKPLTIDDDGHIYGHAATFGVCHMGYPDKCVEAPRSERGYTHFRTGAVHTAGGLVSVGQITMDTGHPPLHLSAADAIRHYDDTGTVVADVAAGEDPHGIWLNGQMRPGVPREKWRALQAASISGDWRPVGGKAEFVAALAVNVPGFPIPRPELLVASAGEAMVAVGVVTSAELEVEAIAAAVVRRLDEQATRRQRVTTLRAQVNEMRLAALHAQVPAES